MVEDDALVDVAGRIADGAIVDWPEVTSTMRFDETREIAQELAVLGQIAAAHRQLHQLLPASADAAPSPTADRSRWAHLDLLNVVGRGSYGVVYRAWDTRLERLVALKLFHGAANPDAVMQEGRMLARVRHEKFVTVYGADVIDGVAGIWMELVHGKTLDHIVKTDGPLPVREAASVGIDVAKALAAVHAAGLLHCDVKAQNVVRETTGRVVLMDLGAGRMVPESSDGDQISDVAGTPRYMAPELFATGATATRSSDIYSFGVLLYYLVSRAYPVDGKTLGELKQAHGAGSSRALGEVRRGLPRAFLDIVSRALDPDPARRPESAAEIEAALTPVASPAPLVKRWWLAAAAAAGIVLLLATARPLFTPAPTIESIAVLPIKNLTGDAGKAYIATGLTELLIANLARVPRLRVPSFAAVAPVMEDANPSGELAARLGVNLILAGSIMQSSDEIRLAIHLTDEEGNAVWGDELTRPLAGIMRAQGDLTRRLAQRLSLDLSSASAAIDSLATMDSRAQDAYLRGLALRVSSPSAQPEAARAFRESVDLEPALADAWAHLSLIETALGERMTGDDRQRSRQLARQLAERAISLDPLGPNGHAALGSIQFYVDWDFAAAEKTLKHTIELSPSAAFARQRYAMLLSALGRHQEAITVAAESQRLEPTVAIRSTTLGTAYYYARDFGRAAEEMRRALQVTPGFGVAHFGLGRIASAEGRHDVAVAEIERALGQDRNASWLVELARVYAAAGRADDTRTVLAELERRQASGDAFSSDNLAYIAAAAGRIDDAFAILDRAVGDRLAAMLWLAVDPRVDPLRHDPRFDQLIARMGLR